MNLRERNETGVIPIALFETYTNGKEDAIKLFDSFANTIYSSHKDHGENVINVIKKFVPNAEFYMFPMHSEAARKYVAENYFPIVNISLATPAVFSYMEEIAEKSFIVQAVGNDGPDGEVIGAQWEKCCAVGAVNAILEPQNYSGYGLDAVDTCAITGIAYDGKVLHGTSFAAPVVTGLIAQYFIWHKKVVGVYPNPKAAFDFVVRNSHDIWDDGIDERTGNGLFRLPQEFTLTAVHLFEGSDIGRRIKFYENRPNYIEEFDAVLPVLNIDGRVRVSPRGVGNGFEKTTGWNNEQKYAWFV